MGGITESKKNFPYHFMASNILTFPGHYLCEPTKLACQHSQPRESIEQTPSAIFYRLNPIISRKFTSPSKCTENVKPKLQIYGKM